MAAKNPININTASQEELMKIRDIGEVKSKLIIQARKAKSTPLTLEDLKLIEGISSTMWDPLVKAGRIIFEETTTIEEDKQIQQEIPPKETDATRYQNEIIQLKQLL